LGLIRHPQLFKGLRMGPAIIGISGMMYIADLQQSRREGYGNDVQAYREANAANIVSEFSSYVITFLSFMTLSPGGGGPGQSLTSTDPPPSVEEVGTMITQGAHPMKGGHPDSSKVSRGRSRKRCPPGYRWNGKRCVRKV
jgi:hypothetical protein